MSVTNDKQDGEVDDDRLFLDQVLNKLYDFGDGENKRSKKCLKRKKNLSKDDNAGTVNEAEGNADTDSNPAGTKQSKVEVVTFVDPLKKNKLSQSVEPKQKVPDVKEKMMMTMKKKGLDEKLTIEKARFEVHRFGLSGYQKQQQRVFEEERAIMLGARPPKKQYVNYKVYQQQLKERKMKEKEEAKPELQKKRRKEGKPRTEKSKPSSSRELGGQVGRFKNGMLVLSSKEIQKFNSKGKK
ncbi:uncharacterized protein C1orf131 homolog [Danio rerio]|uniref:Uncharacterized protein C1orf131 homolog n=1 Tax=Danio rerio TaxID=7955 RepID=B3DHE5_DANRE|nr:uncharacterized protein C1orf131 homolog [Danio rerio]AAI62736.1 Zgc:194224 [Danio rerio]|eukprot:NP_001124266.1 uncharacterized protein C1orf131 homolog [Danio rerio]